MGVVQCDVCDKLGSTRSASLITHSLKTMQNVRAFEHLGAHPLSKGGVHFAVWAPDAVRVSVVGDFNSWDPKSSPLVREGGSGIWSGDVSSATLGNRYKFAISTHGERMLPLKADPYARASELRPATASVVAPMPEKKSLSAARANANKRNSPISIYEVHLGSWRRHFDGCVYGWDELAAELPLYAVSLGFTHIELLPISEHPFDGSWGYQTLGMFAPTARFGSPEGFTRFVKVCHAQNLGVILDWVPAHFPIDEHGLARFDGTALYEHADPREGFHRDWGTLIYNYGRFEVRDFLLGSALYWIERFGVDGLRVDAVASMLYRDYSRNAGEWVPNKFGGRENLEAIDLLKTMNEQLGIHCPGAITLAEESTAFPKVSAPTYEGGLGFHYKWNMGWMNDTLRYMQEDPAHRRWHHSKMTFGFVCAFNENFVLPLSHDEVVHGKKSLLGKMPGDEWQRFANLRAYYGFMWGHPGKKLLFMGQEFAQPDEWNHDTELPWGLLQNAKHAGIQRLVGDLNRIYRDRSALHECDADSHGFEWLVADDEVHSVFAWIRRDEIGNEIIVLSNLTPVTRYSYRVGVPLNALVWRELLNTDAVVYGGSNVGNLNADISVEAIACGAYAKSIRLTLPPLATIFLAPI
jgi:1,4-alpha-glucan branching enzyme